MQDLFQKVNTHVAVAFGAIHQDRTTGETQNVDGRHKPGRCACMTERVAKVAIPGTIHLRSALRPLGRGQSDLGRLALDSVAATSCEKGSEHALTGLLPIESTELLASESQSAGTPPV